MVIASIGFGLFGIFFGVYFGLYQTQICREENTQLRVLLGRVINSRYLQLFPPSEVSEVRWDQFDDITHEEMSGISFQSGTIDSLTQFVDKFCPYVLTAKFPQEHGREAD